jgi:HNH endonuclease
MDAATCIYCGKVSTTRFPREHVIPTAFGQFQNNLTLDCVCGSCNAYFGRELEVVLTRDSIEALLRVRHGVKAKNEAREIGRSRLSCKVVSLGEHSGARIVPERNSSEPIPRGKPVAQVAFRKFGEEEWHRFLEAELDDVQRWERFRVDAEATIMGPPDEDLTRLCRKLESFGVVFKKVSALERIGGLSQMYAEPLFDDVLFRGIAKIAFNFLAHVMGAPFAAREEFRSVRNYVRHGTAQLTAPVSVVGISKSKEDDGLSLRKGGHTISLWRDGRNYIVSRVTLFDHLTYEVVLGETEPTIWYPLDERCYFDLPTRRIDRFFCRN